MARHATGAVQLSTRILRRDKKKQKNIEQSDRRQVCPSRGIRLVIDTELKFAMTGQSPILFRYSDFILNLYAFTVRYYTVADVPGYCTVQ